MEKVCLTSPVVMTCGPLSVGVDGQGIGSNAFGSLSAGIGITTNFLALPPYLIIARLNWKTLASSRNGLELRLWWRDAHLPNKTKGVWAKLQGPEKVLGY